MKKTWFAESGNAVVANDIQNDNELRGKRQEKTFGSVISGFNPTKNGTNTVTISTGSILVEGRLLTRLTQIDHVLTDLTQDQIVYIYYDSTLDIAPNYDCLIVKNHPASTYTEPDNDGTYNTCVPIAHVLVSGGVIVTVHNISPRNVISYLHLSRSNVITTADLLGLRGVLTVENSATGTTLANKNFAFRAMMDKTKGYAQIIKGRLLFEGNGLSAISIDYSDGNDFLVQNNDATKNFIKFGYYNGTGDDTRVEIVAERFIVSSVVDFNGVVNYANDVIITGSHKFSGKVMEYAESKFTNHYFNMHVAPLETQNITISLDIPSGNSSMQTNNAAGGYTHWLLLPNYSFQYGTSGTYKNKIKSIWFKASSTSTVTIYEVALDGSSTIVIKSTNTQSSEVTVNEEMDNDKQYIIRWSASANSVSLDYINIIIEEIYA